jgi:amino acid transporter
VILLRIRHPRIHRPFRVPGSVAGIPLLPIAGVVASVALLTRLDPAVIGLGIVLVAIGSGYALLKVRGKEGMEYPVASS